MGTVIGVDTFQKAIEKTTLKKDVGILIDTRNDELEGGYSVKLAPINRIGELPYNIQVLYMTDNIFEGISERYIRLSVVKKLNDGFSLVDNITALSVIDVEGIKMLSMKDDTSDITMNIICDTPDEKEAEEINKEEMIMNVNSINEKTVSLYPLDQHTINKLKKLSTLEEVLFLTITDSDIYIRTEREVGSGIAIKLTRHNNSNFKDLFKDAVNKYKTMTISDIRIGKELYKDSLNSTYMAVAFKNVISVLDKNSEIDLLLLRTGSIVIRETTQNMVVFYGLIPTS